MYIPIREQKARKQTTNRQSSQRDREALPIEKLKADDAIRVDWERKTHRCTVIEVVSTAFYGLVVVVMFPDGNVRRVAAGLVRRM